MQGEVVVGEKGVADEVDIRKGACVESEGNFAFGGEACGCVCEGVSIEEGGSLVGEFEGEDSEELDEEYADEDESGDEGEVAFSAAFFVFEIEQHDDEQEEDHDGAGVDEDLDDADEECG